VGCFIFTILEEKLMNVDITAIKFNQAALITFTLLGFIVNQPYLALLVGLVLAVGTIAPGAALFKLIYEQIFKPLGWLKANVINDDPAPHQFAVGALFLLSGSIALLVFKATILGWSLAWIVIILAAVNLFFSFCAGCFVYYQLQRLGVIARANRS
jgi:hypothetical protein